MQLKQFFFQEGKEIVYCETSPNILISDLPYITFKIYFLATQLLCLEISLVKVNAVI